MSLINRCPALSALPTVVHCFFLLRILIESFIYSSICCHLSKHERRPEIENMIIRFIIINKVTYCINP